MTKVPSASSHQPADRVQCGPDEWPVALGVRRWTVVCSVIHEDGDGCR